MADVNLSKEERGYVDAFKRAFQNIPFVDGGDPYDEFLVVDGWVSIGRGPVNEVVKTIAGVATYVREGYVVNVICVTPGSYWEPEDVDVSEDSRHVGLLSSLSQAVRLVTENVIKVAIESTMDSDVAVDSNS